MKKTDLQSRIQQFCKDKHLENAFIQECVKEFIERHNELYGDVISVEELFARLENNLNGISFVGPNESSMLTRGNYTGRIDDNTDVNQIFVYFDLEDLDLKESDKKLWDLYTQKDKDEILKNLEEKRLEIKLVIIHELVHCAYTIKNELGQGESHIFSSNQKNSITGKYSTYGQTCFVEPVVEYIKTRIMNQDPHTLDSYPAETKAIYMLVEKLGERLIIQSAWFSNEYEFKERYKQAVTLDSNIGEQSYETLIKLMKTLRSLDNNEKDLVYYFKREESLLLDLQKLLDGKIDEVEFNKFQLVNRTLQRLNKKTLSLT